MDGKTGGWLNHPATLMWWNNGKPFAPALIKYAAAMIEEWEQRLYKNNMSLEAAKAECAKRGDALEWRDPVFTPQLHESHVCRLMQKDEVFYSKKFGTHGIHVPAHWRDVPYDWTPGA